MEINQSMMDKRAVIRDRIIRCFLAGILFFFAAIFLQCNINCEPKREPYITYTENDSSGNQIRIIDQMSMMANDKKVQVSSVDVDSRVIKLAPMSNRTVLLPASSGQNAFDTIVLSYSRTVFYDESDCGFHVNVNEIRVSSFTMNKLKYAEIKQDGKLQLKFKQ